MKFDSYVGERVVITEKESHYRVLSDISDYNGKGHNQLLRPDGDKFRYVSQMINSMGLSEGVVIDVTSLGRTRVAVIDFNGNVVLWEFNDLKHQDGLMFSIKLPDELFEV